MIAVAFTYYPPGGEHTQWFQLPAVPRVGDSVRPPIETHRKPDSKDLPRQPRVMGRRPSRTPRLARRSVAVGLDFPHGSRHEASSARADDPVKLFR
jgi:hypothetical protein